MKFPTLLLSLLLQLGCGFTPFLQQTKFNKVHYHSSSSKLHSTTESKSSSDYAAPISEIDRRRNLAIISHPDSGKTTMTEKLLLYGGAIQQAGAVRQKAEQRGTASDFMEMEKERGISISSTVMNFDYDGLKINILDTPGHEDFSEDTYRALAAADNAVMLLGKVLASSSRGERAFFLLFFTASED